LRCVLSKAVGLEPLPSWQEAISEFVAADFSDRHEEARFGSV
jgi:hypothetical protein